MFIYHFFEIYMFIHMFKSYMFAIKHDISTWST